MKLYTVPSRSPWRLYTAVPSTLLDAISSSVSSVATEPLDEVAPLVPTPMPDVVVPLMPAPMLDVFAIVASSRCTAGRWVEQRVPRDPARGLGLPEPPPYVLTVRTAICVGVHPSR